jgi:membrane-associated phospholipid phosphatase
LGIIVLMLFAVSSPVRAGVDEEEEGRIKFSPALDLTLAAGVSAAVIGFEFGYKGDPRGTWTAGPVDKGLAGLFEFRQPEDRNFAAQVGDWGMYGMAGYTVLLDPLLIFLIDDVNDAFKVSVINIEAIAIAGAIVRPFQKLGKRSRPMQDDCLKDSNYANRCDETSESLLSGHVATTAAAAASSCYLNRKLDTQGSLAKCGIGFAMVGLTGWTQMASGLHWFSDIATGTGIGLVTGYLVAKMHWDNGKDDLTKGPRTVLVPYGSTNGAGVMYAGSL